MSQRLLVCSWCRFRKRKQHQASSACPGLPQTFPVSKKTGGCCRTFDFPAPRLAFSGAAYLRASASSAASARPACAADMNDNQSCILEQKNDRQIVEKYLQGKVETMGNKTRQSSAEESERGSSEWCATQKGDFPRMIACRVLSI